MTPGKPLPELVFLIAVFKRLAERGRRLRALEKQTTKIADDVHSKQVGGKSVEEKRP